LALFSLTGYAAVAVWATWPLARSISGALPLGTEPVATVPLFNLWTIWWNADRAAHLFRDYWNAPIFHPTEATFAFSEPQPTSLIVAPAVWAGETALGYNLYLLAALTLNGWSAFRLLRRVELRPIPAFAGGLMVELLPIVHWQLGVLQLAPLCGVVWTIHALYNFGRDPTVGRSLLLGAAFAVTYLLCNYHGLFLSVLLALSGWWLLGPQITNWRAWLRLLPGAALCLAVIGPMIWLQMRLSREHDWRRSPELLQSLSAHWKDYLAPPWEPLVPMPGAPKEPGVWRVGPGTIKAVLAFCGVLWGLAIRGRRMFTLFCLTSAAVAAALSLGPNLEVRGWQPYQLLIDYYPGIAQARNVFRFAFFAQLSVALLAGIGLEMLAAGLARGFALLRGYAETGEAPGGWRGWIHPARGMSAVRVILMAAAGGAAAFEVVPARQRLFPIPSVARNDAWTSWLRDETPEESVIACVPFPSGIDAQAYFHQTIWMYWGMFHGRTMVNGYSGFFPETFFELKDAMQSFPHPDSLDKLRTQDVRYAVVWRAVMRREYLFRHPRLAERLQWRFSDDRAGIDIYELR
jgi:hypothetical protein